MKDNTIQPIVTVFTTATCPYCVMLKRWLDEKGIAHNEYRVDRNPYAAKIMTQISGQMGVPFTTIERDGTMHKIVGFDRAKLQTALA